MGEEEKQKRTKGGGGKQNLGNTSIRCGCGFSTSNPHEWSEHRKEHLKKK